MVQRDKMAPEELVSSSSSHKFLHTFFSGTEKEGVFRSSRGKAVQILREVSEAEQVWWVLQLFQRICEI